MATSATFIHGHLRILLSLLLFLLVTAEGRAHSTAMHRHLMRINKPSIKSIQSANKDIIDCVYISHQPAFDHPFLCNHTIQVPLLMHIYFTSFYLFCNFRILK